MTTVIGSRRVFIVPSSSVFEIEEDDYTLIRLPVTWNLHRKDR